MVSVDILYDEKKKGSYLIARIWLGLPLSLTSNLIDK